MRKILAAAVTVFCLTSLALNGCSLGPAETTPPHIYLLTPDIALKGVFPPTVRDVHSTLLIGALKAQPGFGTTRMAYLRREYELSYYAFSQWADTPGRMLLPALAQAMEATRMWGAIAQAPALLRADYRLDCDNLALEQQFFSTPSRVRLAVRAQLVDTKRQSVIGTRSFEIFQTSASEDAYGGVVAANEASTMLLDQMTDWLQTLMDEETAGPE